MATGDPNNPSAPQPPIIPTEFDVTTAKELAATVEVIAAASKVVSTTFEALKGTTGKWAEDLKEATEFVNTAFRTITATSESFNKMRESGEAFNRLMKIKGDMEKESKQMYEFYKGSVKELTSYWEDANIALGKFLDKQAQGAMGHQALKVASTADQAGHALKNVESLPGKLLNMVPGGGFIDFLIWGAGKQADWDAKTQKVVQQFDSMGGGADRFKGTIQGNIKAMEIWNDNATQDLIQISNAFKVSGITAEQAWGRQGVEGNLSTIGKSLTEVTYKFDNMMEVAAGTGAQLVGAGFKEFGNTIKDSAEFITKYGLAAQQAGQESMAFLGSVMQNAEGLKLYHVQLSAVADQQLRLIELNRQRGLDQAYAGTVAQAGQAQAFGGIQAMNEGYAAFIGERVVRSLGPAARAKLDEQGGFGSSPVGILMEMKRGFRDLGSDSASKDALGTMVKEIARQAKEAAGPDRAMQEFYLMKMGFGVEGGRAMLDMAKDVNAGKEVSQKQLDTLKNATESESQKTSSMKQALNLLVQATADVANGMLGMILQGIKIIVIALKGILDFFTTGGIKDSTKEAMEAATDSFAKSATQFGEGLRKVPAAGGKLMDSGALGDFANGPWGFDDNDTKAGRASAHNDAIAAIVARDTKPQGIDDQNWKTYMAEYFKTRREGKSVEDATYIIKDLAERRGDSDIAGAFGSKVGAAEGYADAAASKYKDDHTEVEIGHDAQGVFYVVKTQSSTKLRPKGAQTKRKSASVRKTSDAPGR